MYFGATNGDEWLDAFDDLADLFERAAADDTPIRKIIGADPVDFANTFAASYGQAGWITKEGQRLTQAVDQAEQEQAAQA